MTRKTSFRCFIQKHKNEIIVGIITSFLWFFIESIFNNAPKAGKTFIGTIINLVYSTAAKTSSGTIVSCILTFLFCTGFICVSVPFFYIYINRKYDKKYKKHIQKTNELYDKIEEYQKDSEKNKAEIENCLKEIKECDEEYLSDPPKRIKTYIAFFILLIISIIYTDLYIFKPISLINDFERDIKMIKPYTDSKTITMLESDWTRMQSKDDYDSIYETINRIKDDNNLPE